MDGRGLTYIIIITFLSYEYPTTQINKPHAETITRQTDKQTKSKKECERENSE